MDRTKPQTTATVLKETILYAPTTAHWLTTRSQQHTRTFYQASFAQHELVFRRLGDQALLERCSDGMTQNAIESLHCCRRACQRPAGQLGYNTENCLTCRSLEEDKQRLRNADKARTG
ncbi:hypothetical protein HPB47_011437 [Ixodes persulcatus]|uniref:Uncharacterized protein n=1 Tax=Ixodes persulcatus TaxID=34615 RepID=A0AC60NWB1_IXOPE|nr:hypothetical protein HPB47_011437 [Ixodes persulcatus]